MTCYLGSVNRWECDENDHMNVRFYAQKVNQAIQVFLFESGILQFESGQSLLQRIRSQHIRFLVEARFGSPLQIECGLAAVRDNELDILQLIRKGRSGELLCSFVTTVDIDGMHSGNAHLVQLPEKAGARGLDADVDYGGASYDEAIKAGYCRTGRGIVGIDECDLDGRMLPHHFIGRISDGIPNLWDALNDKEWSSAIERGEFGGAVVEYRLQLRQPVSRGSVFSHLCGFSALGNRTFHLSHIFLDDSNGRCSARAEAVGVFLDLETRKASPINDDLRQRLAALLVEKVRFEAP